MSGSVVTNVLTTGQLTIPAMKRVGMSGEIAGGVEACASTGGVLLPPIMGSTAFVMATFLEIPYYQIALAAALPALLYFGGLFLQVDATAARQALAGVDRSELPRVSAVLKGGWHYLGAFGLLIFLLLVMQREAVAPYLGPPDLESAHPGPSVVGGARRGVSGRDRAAAGGTPDHPRGSGAHRGSAVCDRAVRDPGQRSPVHCR